MTAPATERRRPSAPKKLAASLLSMGAIAALLYALVGMLTSETAGGLLVAGVLFGGGGVVVARTAWRLYRGTPAAWELAQGRTPAEVRALSRELARRQWLAAAKFLLALTAVYLLLALLLEDHQAGLVAAAFTALTAAGLWLLNWLQGRRSS